MTEQKRKIGRPLKSDKKKGDKNNVWYYGYKRV